MKLKCKATLSFGEGKEKNILNFQNWLNYLEFNNRQSEFSKVWMLKYLVEWIQLAVYMYSFLLARAYFLCFYAVKSILWYIRLNLDSPQFSCPTFSLTSSLNLRVVVMGFLTLRNLLALFFFENLELACYIGCCSKCGSWKIM